MTKRTRREWLCLVGAGGVAGLASCSSSQKPVTAKWTFETGRIVASSPTVVDSTVYVGKLHDNVYALSATAGTEQWVQAASGGYSSPAVVDDTVYFGRGDIYARA
ncbi:MAG: hypothetical protein J07HX64_02949 [halophilic archaeon J07HX64]|jgi:hypothetical protein|nr:MAG: hypothetical protein J07HX64_02949 [halophilic archaeon J07HX64]